MNYILTLDFLILYSFIPQFIRTEVSDKFSRCRDIFYHDEPPFMNGLRNERHICQRRRNRYFYGTNYNVAKKIPHYSGYKIDSFDITVGRTAFRRNWCLEPQIKGIQERPDMVEDRGQQKYIDNQATDLDYKSSGYDRGHLNPASYHRETPDSYLATFTLTNIAPQVPNFNQGVWRTMEEAILDQMNTYCNFVGARRYLITGVVPGGRTLKDQKRVNIPDYFWTAACCDSSNGNFDDNLTGWSAGFLGQNIPESSIYVYEIEDLLHFLARKTSSGRPFLFKDISMQDGQIIRNCQFNLTRANEIVDDIVGTNARFYKQSRFNKILSKAYTYIRDRFFG